jgi:flagellar hook-associated protein 3 FlgL
MRVTDGSANLASLTGMQNAASRLAAVQAQLSSGRLIQRPSDNPAGTGQALALRSDIKRTTQYATNSSDAVAWMSTADTAYTQIVNLTQKARTLVVQGLNTGGTSQQGQDALADQIDGLRESLISLANTQYNGRPVFGGTTSGPAAYDASGTYVGDSGVVARTVAPGSTVQINQTGPQVFGAPGSDLFSLLSSISTALRSNSAALSTALGSLDTAIDRVGGAQASEGAAYQRVQTAQATQSQNLVTLQSQLSDLQDIDVAEMAVQVSTANVTYQAALQTTANVRQTSLLDFLR